MLTSIATLVGLQVTKAYTATAQVMIEPGESQIVDLEKVAQQLSPGDSAMIETQIKIIQSPETLARTVDELILMASLESASGHATAGESISRHLSVLASWLPDWMADRLGTRWAMAAGAATAEPIEAATEVLREKAVTALQDNLQVAQSGSSYILSISYTSTDPREAARIANGIADAYIDGQLEEKLAATRRANSWLAEQVEEFRARVLESENAIEAYRASRGLVETGASLDGQQLATLTTSLIEGRAERSAKEAQHLRYLGDLWRSESGFEASADILSSPLILSLREREIELLREEATLSHEYGERHPLILQLRAEKQKLADRVHREVQSLIANLESDIALARNRERFLEQGLNEAKGHSVVTGRAEVQLRELEREAGANRSLYETFLTRLKETEHQQEIVQPNARLISPARAPDEPSSPPPTLFAVVGFTASTVFGSILAFLLEQLDSRLRSTRQAEHALGLHALGFVPKVKSRRRQPLHRHLVDKPRSAYAQSVQALYMQLRRPPTGTQPPRIILVTSALPGEGKTSLAVSLATCAAQLGQKTLLVELDLRRPAVARQFWAEIRPDLLDVLEGRASAELAIRRDPDTGLDVLAAAGRHENPIKLLTSQRLKAVLREVGARYDYVVLDTPPVLGVPDAKALAAQADAILFVVQWDRTKRAAAVAALKELAGASAEVAGVVLAQADLKKHASYAYGDAGEYYNEYRKYYAS